MTTTIVCIVLIVLVAATAALWAHIENEQRKERRASIRRLHSVDTLTKVCNQLHRA